MDFKVGSASCRRMILDLWRVRSEKLRADKRLGLSLEREDEVQDSIAYTKGEAKQPETGITSSKRFQELPGSCQTKSGARAPAALCALQLYARDSSPFGILREAGRNFNHHY